MSKAKALSDLLAVHDDNVIIPNKLRARLAAMLKIGPEEHDYEQKFLQDAGVSNNKIGAFRDMFKRHVVNTGGKNPKRVWFADPKIAAKFRAAIGDNTDV